MISTGTPVSPPADLIEQVDRATVRPGQIALWYTGAAGYIVRTPESTIYIDPYCGTTADIQRGVPVPFEPGSVRRCDLILSTHEHLDHCDDATLMPMLAGTTAPLAGPASSTTKAKGFGWPDDRLITLEHGGTYQVKDVRLTTVRAYDPMAEGANGYVIEAGGVTIANLGDSLLYPDIGKVLEPFGIDALCVSVADNPPNNTWYMTEADACRAARDSGAKMLIPHHFDMWLPMVLDPRRIAAM